MADAFGLAADYDAHADLQRTVAGRLADRVAALPLPPRPRILEIGCGTGFLGAALLDRLPDARWLMTDISPAMLARAQARFGTHDGIAYARMDGERPDVPGHFDLIVSSLAVQWFADLPRALALWRDLLAPAGRIAFTTLVRGSLAEWHDAHGALPAGTPEFLGADELDSMGLAVTVETLTVPYADARAFLRAVKAIGAGTPRPGHRPLTPAQLRTVMARFDAAGACARYVVATCVYEDRDRQR